nr:hypothetical protein [Tanacetum cinerariifolium]
MPTELLPPCKRFVALERIEALEREVESLTARLAAAMILIDTLLRDDIGRNVREVRIEARVKRVEDAIQGRQIHYIHYAENEMSWKEMKKLMTEAYCPKNEIHKLEGKLWNLTVKASDGPVRRQDAVKLTNSLMDQKVRTHAARQADNKRRLENTPRDNHVQQLPFKKHNVARAYTDGLVKRVVMLASYLWATDASCERGGSIARMGGGSLAKHLMESNYGLGGVENKSLVGSKLMASGEECLDGWVRAGGGEVKGGGGVFRVSRILLSVIPEDIMGESGGEAFGVDGGSD